MLVFRSYHRILTGAFLLVRVADKTPKAKFQCSLYFKGYHEAWTPCPGVSRRCKIYRTSCSWASTDRLAYSKVQIQRGGALQSWDETSALFTGLGDSGNERISGDIGASEITGAWCVHSSETPGPVLLGRVFHVPLESVYAS